MLGMHTMYCGDCAGVLLHMQTEIYLNHKGIIIEKCIRYSINLWGAEPQSCHMKILLISYVNRVDMEHFHNISTLKSPQLLF